MTGILTEQKFTSDCRYRVIESSSLVSVLFIEVFSHPYISFFNLLVNGFDVTSNNKICLQDLFYFNSDKISPHSVNKYL